MTSGLASLLFVWVLLNQAGVPLPPCLPET